MQVTNQQIKECVDLRACAYTNWHKKFRKITFDSICIPLPEEIIKYLLDEIIILPKECYSDDDNDDAFETETSATTVTNNDEDGEEDEDGEDITVRILNEIILTSHFKII